MDDFWLYLLPGCSLSVLSILRQTRTIGYKSIVNQDNNFFLYVKDTMQTTVPLLSFSKSQNIIFQINKIYLPTETCLPSSMSESQTIGLVQIFKTGHGLCSNKNPIRGFTECQGTCQSGSKYNPRKYLWLRKNFSSLNVDSSLSLLFFKYHMARIRSVCVALFKDT